MTEPANNLKDLNTPDKIAAAGEKIYEERYRAKLEPEQNGQFIAIDVATGEGYIGEFPEIATKKANEAAPLAVIHLIRIGAPGGFKVSYNLTHHNDWWNRALRQTG